MNKITVRVITENGYNWTTEINGTLISAQKYFLGQDFDTSNDPEGDEVMSRAVRVDLVDDWQERAIERVAMRRWLRKIGREPELGITQADTDRLASEIETMGGEPYRIIRDYHDLRARLLVGL